MQDLQKLKSEEYKKINPLQTVPTLKDGKTLIREAGACNQFLLEQYSNGRLQPPQSHKEARGEYLDWQWFGELSTLKGKLSHVVIICWVSSLLCGC